MEINLSNGVQEVSVNGVRTIRFNPTDMGFLENIYALLAKLDAIQQDCKKKREKAGDDLVKIFEISRLQDKRMREAVDSFFGEGFCDDVFQEVRLTAAVDGLTVVDNLLFSVIDLMDADVNENLVKRNERIARYTEKYQRRKK